VAERSVPHLSELCVQYGLHIPNQHLADREVNHSRVTYTESELRQNALFGLLNLGNWNANRLKVVKTPDGLKGARVHLWV